MMKKHLPYIVSILTGLVFVFSGVVKLFPIYAFEQQIVSQNLMGWTLAQIFSRALIGFEIGLGLLLLQKWNVKKLIIPAALILLASFTIYLAYELWISNGQYTSCGCFGEVFPMSVGASLLKNAILIAALVYVQFFTDDKPGKTGLQLLLFAVVYILLFVLFPVKKFEPPKKLPLSFTYVKNPDTAHTIDTTSKKLPPVKEAQSGVKEEAVPVKVQSQYSAFTSFLWKGKNIHVDVNDGKKIVCMLSLDCDHCMAAATEIAALQSKKGMPQVVAMYFGEESELQPFTTKTHFSVPYIIVSPEKFFPLIKKVPPRITLLNNGNVLGDWNGEEFKISELKKLLSL
jgi:hypothetical protein